MGQFKLQRSSLTYDNVGGTISVRIDLDGQADGFGRTLGTLGANPANADEGSWSWTGVSFPDTGDSQTGVGTGTFRKTSASVWALEGHIDISGGSRADLSGSFNLLDGTFSGSLS